MERGRREKERKRKIRRAGADESAVSWLVTLQRAETMSLPEDSVSL